MIMPKRPELGASEKQAYDRAYERREDAIITAIEKLVNRNLLAEDEAEREQNSTRIAVLEDELDVHTQKRVAYIVGRHAINPPSREQLDRLGSHLEEIASLDTQCRIVERIAALSRDGAGTFDEIHPTRQ